jgi:predicted transcriptional regulator
MAVAAVQVMFRRLDQLGSADALDLANSQVAEGLNLLVSMGLLTKERKEEIEKGI